MIYDSLLTALMAVIFENVSQSVWIGVLHVDTSVAGCITIVRPMRQHTTDLAAVENNHPITPDICICRP